MYVLILSLLFLLFREVITWYFKLNEITELLKKIDKKLDVNNKYFKETARLEKTDKKEKISKNVVYEKSKGNHRNESFIEKQT